MFSEGHHYARGSKIQNIDAQFISGFYLYQQLLYFARHQEGHVKFRIFTTLGERRKLRRRNPAASDQIMLAYFSRLHLSKYQLVDSN